MKVAIHQPEAFPWLGFFYKMYASDIFVILDTVQFEKNSVQNRNKILKNKEPGWLTIPLIRTALDTPINQIKINWHDPLIKKHLSTLKNNYSKHPFFNEIYPHLEVLYGEKPEKLVDFNMGFILLMKEKLGISTKMIKSSELLLSGTALGGTEVTLEINKLLGANEYLSGKGARAYLKLERYKEEGITVNFLEFKHPTYAQSYTKNFCSHLSILDLYFNHGPQSLEIILKDNTTIK